MSVKIQIALLRGSKVVVGSDDRGAKALGESPKVLRR